MAPTVQFILHSVWIVFVIKATNMPVAKKLRRKKFIGQNCSLRGIEQPDFSRVWSIQTNIRWCYVPGLVDSRLYIFKCQYLHVRTSWLRRLFWNLDFNCLLSYEQNDRHRSDNQIRQPFDVTSAMSLAQNFRLREQFHGWVYQKQVSTHWIRTGNHVRNTPVNVMQLILRWNRYLNVLQSITAYQSIPPIWHLYGLPGLVQGIYRLLRWLWTCLVSEDNSESLHV